MSRKNQDSKTLLADLAKYYTPTALTLSGLQALSKIPSGTINELTRRALYKKFKSKRELRAIKGSSLGRGVAKAVAHMPVALATTPIFFSGLAGIRSKDPEERRRGVAKAFLGAGLYGLGTGFIGQHVIRRTSGDIVSPRKMAVGEMLTSTIKALPLLVGVALAPKLVEEDDNKLRAALAAGAVAAGGSAVMELPAMIAMFPQEARSWAGFKKTILPRLAGVTAGSLFSGAVLKELLDKYKQSQAKKKSLRKQAAANQKEQTEDKKIPGTRLPLLPFQDRALDKFVSNRGVILLAHPTGSGKTITSIAAQQLLRLTGHSKTSLIVVPAGLKKNYADALKQYLEDPGRIVIVGRRKGQTPPEELKNLDKKPDFVIVSYSTLHKYPEIVDTVSPDTLVADEVHKVRGRKKLYETLMYARSRTRYFIGMTASVVNNTPEEVVGMLSLVFGRPVMSAARFKKLFMPKETEVAGFFSSSKELPQLVPNEALVRFGKFIDYLPPSATLEGIAPKKQVEYVTVPMSQTQEQYYRYVLKQLNPITAWKIRHRVPLNDKELKNALQILNAARQVSNSVTAVNPGIDPLRAVKESPKLARVVQDTLDHLKENPNGKVIIYSNYVTHGLKPIAAALEAAGVPYGVFVGRGRKLGGVVSTEEERNRAVENYKKGRVKVLLISGAGAEGLDLPDTTMVQVVDGHYNPERIIQAESRGIRIGGLSYLPPQQRRVVVKRYVAETQPTLWDKLFGRTPKSIDSYVYAIASAKRSNTSKLLTTLAAAEPEDEHVAERLVTQLKRKKQESTVTGETRADSRPPKLKGVLLDKKPGAKYTKRWRTPGGKIVYEYPDKTTRVSY